MRAYSKDLRVKVLEAVDRGTPRAEVAKTFGISLPLIKRWLKRRRDTGEVDAQTPPGPPAVKGTMLGEWLPAQLRSNPDLTLGEHCESFAEDSGVKVSEATMSRAISHLPGGWPLKKRAR
jgi:transposase